MTNREYMIGLLQDAFFIDDDGASYEAMLNYNIQCCYYSSDERCHCRDLGVLEERSRDMCYRCKEEWLDSEVDE